MHDKGYVYNNGILAGTIQYRNNEYIFTYDESYFQNPRLPAISLSLPKTRKEYTLPVLFPFFTGILAEGVNKEIQCKTLKIDERDDFERLLKTAGHETIGAITVREAA